MSSMSFNQVRQNVSPAPCKLYMKSPPLSCTPSPKKVSYFSEGGQNWAQQFVRSHFGSRLNLDWHVRGRGRPLNGLNAIELSIVVKQRRPGCVERQRRSARLSKPDLCTHICRSISARHLVRKQHRTRLSSRRPSRARQLCRSQGSRGTTTPCHTAADNRGGLRQVVAHPRRQQRTVTTGKKTVCVDSVQCVWSVSR